MSCPVAHDTKEEESPCSCHIPTIPPLNDGLFTSPCQPATRNVRDRCTSSVDNASTQTVVLALTPGTRDVGTRHLRTRNGSNRGMPGFKLTKTGVAVHHRVDQDDLRSVCSNLRNDLDCGSRDDEDPSPPPSHWEPRRSTLRAMLQKPAKEDELGHMPG